MTPTDRSSKTPRRAWARPTIARLSTAEAALSAREIAADGAKTVS